MARTIQIGNRLVGEGQPTFFAAEIGINHNGDLEIAKKMMEVAARYGADAVKFQKRTPELCVPPEQRGQMRDTPWGYISYLAYREKVEFNAEQYAEIDRYSKKLGITWFSSVWDVPSVDFMEQYQPVCYKVPSAQLTDHELLRKIRSTGRPMILSTGMSTMEQIRAAVEVAGTKDLMITHATSTYPCEPEELNLRVIQTLQAEFPNVPIGYSGHEVGLIPSVIAVSMGACLVERHITLDRTMWGTDQAASVEPQGIEKLIKYLRVAEKSLGDGEKVVYESEKPSLKKLRRYP